MQNTLAFKADYLDALSNGAVLVTVNQRLSRTLLTQFDGRQQSVGKRVWPGAKILPWQAWLRELYNTLRDQEDRPRQLLNNAQASALWARIVADSDLAADLLDSRAAAKQAHKAWELQLAWRVDCASATTLDQRAFLLWARRYSELCRRNNWLDAANLTDWLCHRADAVAAHLRQRSSGALYLLGFDTLNPAQRSLLSALGASGISVINDALNGSEHDSARLLRCDDTTKELRAAVSWARRQVKENARQRVGIVMPDLAQRRNALLPILAETFDQSSALDPPLRFASPYYDISLGEPLISCAMITDALGWLAWVERALPATQSTPLLLSPFIGEAVEERGLRAAADSRLRRWGGGRLSRKTFVRIARSAAQPPAALLARLDRLSELYSDRPARQSYAHWARTFADLLECIGWPGQAPLSSMEFQLHNAWSEQLRRLAGFDVLAEACSFSQALSALRELLQDTLFQIESQSDAPVQVLGLLEAVGQSFDALWVTSMSEDTWPARTQLNPFLPITAQRDANVPHSSAEWEAEFARRSMRRLYACAGDIVFSFACGDGDENTQPSTLLAGLPEYVPQPDEVIDGYAAAAMQRQATPLEYVTDTIGPSWPPGQPLRGGVDVLSDQAECPFRAFARHRLGANPLAEIHTGIGDRDRGSLLHRTLEYIWRELKTQSALLALNRAALTTIIERAVEHAINSLDTIVDPAFITLEREHLAALVDTWLTLEKTRLPFVVDELEQTHDIGVGDMRLNLRVDRSDVLDDGARVLIDYKTGNPKNQSENWNEVRPGDLQLPLYALADPQRVDAVSFAFVRSQQPQFKGVGDDSVEIRGVVAVKVKFKKTDCENWQAVQMFWRQSIEALAQEFASGVAGVTPRKSPNACQYCPLDPLCRIGNDLKVEENDG